MRTLVIGTRGFLSQSLIKNKQFSETIFIKPEEIVKIDRKSLNIQKIILLSFNSKWKEVPNYDCEVEKSILKVFGSENILIQYISTSKVYANKINLTEESQICPSSIYAENKIIAEEFISKNFKYFHIFRASNIFNNTGGAPNTFLDILIKNLKGNKVMFDVSNQSKRDFISTNFIGNLLSNSHIPHSGIYNLSSAIPIKIIDIIRIIINHNKINKNLLIQSYGDQITSQVLDNTKLIKEFGYSKFSKQELFKELGEINAK